MRRIDFAVSCMFLLLGSCLSVSCVSVDLPGKKILAAKSVAYKDPTAPFKEIDIKNIDRAWLSKKTGNTISFFSECGNDPFLEQLEADILGALNDSKTVKSAKTTFNGRAARQAIATGDIDGIPVKMSVLVFKRNGCSFSLSYGGTAAQFTAEESIFETFKKDFRAP